MEKLLVCQTLKPQGIKGEVKIKLLVDDFYAIKGVKTLYDDSGNSFTVKSLKDATGGFAFLLIDGVDNRNDAELLRGKDFYANKLDIKKEKNAFFISDLIGLKLYAGEKYIGKIAYITQSNVDVFEVDTSKGKCYFPFLNKLNYKIDLKNKSMTVDEKAFLEVSIYEG